MKLTLNAQKGILDWTLKGGPPPKMHIGPKQVVPYDVLIKAGEVEDKDGVLTKLGMAVAERYARAWMIGKRDVDLEREFPDLAGLFYDIRVDSDLARRHAL